MRTMNGRFTNRLPADTAKTAATAAKSVGHAALQAVLIVTAVRLVDAVFQMVMDKRQASRAKAATRRETAAA